MKIAQPCQQILLILWQFCAGATACIRCQSGYSSGGEVVCLDTYQPAKGIIGLF
jgi:hypothetical protein